MNSVISDANQFKTAINTFKLKYNALPGDMGNAQAYWPTCTDNGLNTCNGSNNAKIESDFNNFHEGVRLWEHLALAGIISGSFDSSSQGMMSGYKGFYTGAYNFLPDAQFGSGVRWIAGEFTVSSGAELALSGTQVFTLFRDNTALFNQPDAFNLDTKMDDGKPYSGKVLGIQWYSPSTLCVSSSEYALNRNDPACGMLFEF